MMTPFKCRMYARECRAIADEATQEERAEALNMATIREDLARDHEEAGHRTNQQQGQNPRLPAKVNSRHG